jgi:glycosyltransferase involved in cell wall biosynthesis
MMNWPKKFFIHAINIHNGGGRRLLASLIENLPSDSQVFLLLDERFSLNINPHPRLRVKYFAGTVTQRFFAELWLFRNVRADDEVLCFGNLPPLFSLAGFCTVFVQNRYLLDPVSLKDLSVKLRLRLSIERFWLRYRGSSINQFIVQTPTMLSLMKERAKNWKGAVKMLPFSDQSKDILSMENAADTKSHCEVDFIYVASGEAHKNHSKLIEAWCLLADEGLFPSLWLTVDKEKEPRLCAFIMGNVKARKLRIKNLGTQAPTAIHSLYKQAAALIYPSTFESFGLPLIEAKQANISIIASELDYVRDVIVPDQTFDPQSPVSIARAVKRFLGWQDPPLPLIDAKEFLCSVMQKSTQ